MTDPVSQTVDLAINPLKAPYRSVWLAGLIAFVFSPLMMTVSNQWFSPVLTGIWTILITLLILFLGLRPTNLAWLSILGGVYAFLVDKDKSKGVAIGARWLWDIVISAAFAHFMMGIVATTWDFTGVSGGFMAVWFIGLGFVLWNLKFPTKPWWYQRLTLVVLLISTAGIIWQSLNFDVDIKKDVLYQAAFDPATGEPLKMGYITAGGDWIEDPLGRSPKDCRPVGYKHFSATGEPFPYGSDGTCRSPITGERLIPISKEYVPDASRTTLPGLIDPFFPTPAEREQRKHQAALQAAQQAKAAQQKATPVVKRQPAPTAPTVMHPIGIPNTFVVPGCKTGEWVEIPIPAGWSITPGWNFAAASYQWRSTKTGQWVDDNPPQEGTDKVRLCARAASYVGDTLVPSWKKL